MHLLYWFAHLKRPGNECIFVTAAGALFMSKTDWTSQIAKARRDLASNGLYIDSYVYERVQVDSAASRKQQQDEAIAQLLPKPSKTRNRQGRRHRRKNRSRRV